MAYPAQSLSGEWSHPARLSVVTAITFSGLPVKTVTRKRIFVMAVTVFV
jgi:hypothetical protein